MSLRRMLVVGWLVMLIVAVSAYAQEPQPWTTVGSAGTVDQSSLLFISYEGPSAVMLAFQRGGAVIRYNVVSVAGLTRRDFGALGMGVRYRATPDALIPNRADSQVVAKLIEVNLSTGVSTTLLTFDSNNFPASNDYQTQGVSTCPSGFTFDFQTNAYYIEARLGKSRPISGSPAVQGIQVRSDGCIQ